MYLVAMRRHRGQGNQLDEGNFVADPNVYVASLTDSRLLNESKIGVNSALPGVSVAPFTEAVRYLINTVLFVTAHHECSVARTGKNIPRNAVIHDVRPPANVAVTSEFRRYARGLVADRRVAERKEALMHIVRGHWKSQPTGKGRADRSMIWVRPYQRGADSIGRVVEKTVMVCDV